jgi:hypothetical protein
MMAMMAMIDDGDGGWAMMAMGDDGDGG